MNAPLLERNARIVARRNGGESYASIGKAFDLSRERTRRIVVSHQYKQKDAKRMSTATDRELLLEVARALLMHLRDHRDNIVNSYPNKTFELEQIAHLERLLTDEGLS